MNTTPIQNPFETNKATDFTDSQILEYWVDLVGENALEDLLQPRSPTPMLILGSKGSGKTHLLRYCSYSVRRLRWHDKSIEHIERDGYLGIYLSADGLNASRFAGKGVSSDQWVALFQYYLESWMTQLVIEATIELVRCLTLSDRAESVAVASLLELFDREPELHHKTLNALRAFFIKERKEIDFAVNNAAFTHKVDAIIRFTPGRFLFDGADIFANLLGVSANVRILYLVDELENFTDSQQQFINSLIRARRGRASLRIGARLYGIRTYETNSAGEINKPGAEFNVLQLDEIIRESPGYAKSVRILCAKRLVESGYISGVDVATLAQNLHEYFETPANDPLAELEAQRLTAKYTNDERPYFAKLVDQLTQEHDPPLDSSKAHDVVETLEYQQNPLLEKLNVLLLYQDWAKGKEILTSCNAIAQEMRRFLKLSEKAGRYYENLSHFKSDLLAQLYRECKVRPAYPGLSELIHMSGGVPRNLLGLLKHIVRRAIFNGEQPFVKGAISLDAQRDGVRDAAAWFIDDAQPDQFGTEVRSSINSIGELFKEIRFSDKPVECALSVFSVDSKQLTYEAVSMIRHAENWSFLLRIRGGAKEKNSKAVLEKFQLNPLLSPRWDLSVSRRGTFPLSKDLANAIFDPNQRGRVTELIKIRVRSMNVPFDSRREKTHNLPFTHSDD